MNLLFIDIDTLRPDHMGCYGYHRDTTPNMDQIAREGIRFENTYCADAPCLPSRASLVSGMLGIHHGAVGHGGTAADRRIIGAERDFMDSSDLHNLWHVFRRGGMYTASISTFAERHSSHWFQAGFHETHNVGGRGMESGERVLPVALDWLDRNRDRENWLLHLHLWDPHSPYRAPMDFGNPFENEPMPEWIDESVLQEHLKHVGPHSLRELSMWHDREPEGCPRQPGSAKDLAGVKRIIDGYDCGIRYADSLVGQLFDKLRAYGVYDDTAVIVTSDHGENMGELGIYEEHATADQGTCHIPLIIKWPGCKPGSVDNALHYNIDLAPTMAELLGTWPYEKWDGLSYAKTITGGEACGHEFLVLGQMAHVCQRSVRFGDWIYIRTYHDGLHLFDKEMLFNLKKDPHEQRNLAGEEEYTRLRGAKYLLDWFDNMMAISDSQVDPMQTVLKEGGPFHCRGKLDSYCERLEETGRADGAQALRKRHEEGWLF